MIKPKQTLSMRGMDRIVLNKLNVEQYEQFDTHEILVKIIEKI